MAKEKGFLELNSINLLNAKVDALTKMVSKHQINSLKNTSVVCESCEGSHSYS